MARRTFVARFSARAVESFRGDWAPLEDVFHDPGVAIDFVRHLDPRMGPTIVRAEASGGLAMERAAVAGDWLCDDGDNAGRNVMLPACDMPLLDRWELLGNSIGPGADEVTENFGVVSLADQLNLWAWGPSVAGRSALNIAVTRYAAEAADVLLRLCGSTSVAARAAIDEARRAGETSFNAVFLPPLRAAIEAVSAEAAQGRGGGVDDPGDEALEAAGIAAGLALGVAERRIARARLTYVTAHCMAAVQRSADRPGTTRLFVEVARRCLPTLLILRSAAMMTRTSADFFCASLRRWNRVAEPTSYRRRGPRRRMA